MTKVKICGITNENDALKAAILGADYLGFLVEIDFSEDCVSREEAKSIIKKLPLEISSVFVTYLQKSKPIIEIAKEIKPALIQLHTKINLQEIKKIRSSLPQIKLIKAIPVINKGSIEEAKKYERHVDFILLDTKSEIKSKGRLKEKIGGTGKTHDWNISRAIVKLLGKLNKKVFLAGGLNPSNVGEAIRLVQPYAVDINSGVKLKPRKKNYEKLKLFIEKAKNK